MTNKDSMTSFDEDFKNVVQLRLKLADTKFSMEQMNQKRGDKEDVIDILQQALALYADGKLQKSLKDVKKASDLYNATKALYDENDLRLAEVLKGSLDGATKALQIKLLQYLDDFPIENVDKLIAAIIKQRGKLGIQEPNSIESEFEQIMEKIESLLKSLLDDETHQVSANATDLALTKLSGAMHCAATLVAPENGLKRFENTFPCLGKLALDAKIALTEESNLLVEARESSSLKASDKPNIKAIVLAIEKLVTDDKEKFIHNRSIYRDIREDLELDRSSNGETVVQIQNVSSSLEDKNTTEEYTKSSDEDFDDGLSDVIFPGNDDLE